MNRQSRRAMLSVSKKKETKKNFEKALGLALKVYEDTDKVNVWLKTPLPELSDTTPFQALLYGAGEHIIDGLKQSLTAKRSAESQVQAGAEQLTKLMEQKDIGLEERLDDIFPTPVKEEPCNIEN